MVAQRLRRFVQSIDRRIPDRVPQLRGIALKLFRLLWLVAFLLAIGGPIAGIWMRYQDPTENSELILGSRLGFAVSPFDATLVRFTLGAPDGIRAGDRILAIGGARLPQLVTLSEDIDQSKNPADVTLRNALVAGTTGSQVPLVVRDPDGAVRNVIVTTGEQHIDAAARQHHIAPKLLSFIDLVHVLFYPLLLWLAFSLYTRNRGQPVPSLLSFAILLMMASEFPSSLFVQSLGMPRRFDLVLYDLNNISLLAAVLLFPDARLRPLAILIPLSVLPVLFFLNGQAYQATFVCAAIVGIAVFVYRLRGETGATRQQIKLLFVGLAGYPVLRAISVMFDYTKWGTPSFPQQLLFEALAGITLALSTVSLYLVLFSALRRHRLYDADALFSRSAMIALLTVTMAAFFAAASAGLQAAANVLVGPAAGAWPTIVAAGAAVLLIGPVQKRIDHGAKRLFQKHLLKFRAGLPKRVDDLRETASATTLLEVALHDIVRGLRATRAAAIIGGRVMATVDAETKDVRQWIRVVELPNPPRLGSDREDHLFPVRLPLRTPTDPSLLMGWIVLGPRPDNSLYSRDERQALLEVEESISRAVEVARQRQQAQLAQRRWRQNQEKRLRALEEQVGSLITLGGAWSRQRS